MRRAGEAGMCFGGGGGGGGVTNCRRGIGRHTKMCAYMQ
jgi:hypothetical protein